MTQKTSSETCVVDRSCLSWYDSPSLSQVDMLRLVQELLSGEEERERELGTVILETVFVRCRELPFHNHPGTDCRLGHGVLLPTPGLG